MAKGYIETYRGYRIYDTYAGYVVCDNHGSHVFETKWGLPIVRGMIDDIVDMGTAITF